jgi:aminopeptidase N
MSAPARAAAQLLALALALPLGGCAASPAALLRAAAVANPQASIPTVRPPLVDIRHYDVDVSIDHRAGHVEGQVAIQFAALPGRRATALDLDAVDMDVTGAWDAAGNELQLVQRGDRLRVRLAEPLEADTVGEVTLVYSCFPRRGLYFQGPTATDRERPWHVWTQGETHEARHWIPCWDQPNDRATWTLHAEVDASFRTVAAGRLTDSRAVERTGRRTDTWEQDVPCVSYLFTLVAGELGQVEIPGGPVPLTVVAREKGLADALANFAATPDFVNFFSAYTGLPYPYPKYAQVCVHDFTAGGQENVSATTLTADTIHDPADEPQVSSLDLISHEAAHQWFGDYLTCADWSHLWLNESFATYCEALYRGHTGGEEALRFCVLDMRSRYLGATAEHERPVVWPRYGSPGRMFGVTSYEGGALRLHLLRELLGHDAFRRAVALYVERHAAGTVVTDDLRRSLEESSGMDLRRYFDEFLLGPGFPELAVRVDEGQSGPRLVVEQVQRQRGWREVFHFPVRAAWSRQGLEHEARLELDERSVTLDLAGEGPLDWVDFDSRASVPGRVEQIQTEEQWRAQLRAASSGLARQRAARWFAGDAEVRPDLPAGWQPEPASLVALAAAAGQDPLVPVAQAALQALAGRGPVADEVVSQALLAGAVAGDPRLREAAAEGLSRHAGESALPVLLTLVEDRNASVAAAALASLVDREFPGAFTLCADTAAATDKDRLDEAIVLMLTRIEHDERVLPFVLAAARHEPASRVRVAAVTALAGLAAEDDPAGTVFRQLGESLNDGNFRVRAAAARGLRAWLAGREPGEPRAVAIGTLLAARRVIENDPDVMEALDPSAGLAAP